MSPENKLSRVEVDCSLGNLLDQSIFVTAIWPVGAFVDFAEQSGYQGLQWHPVRTVAGLQMMCGLVSEKSRGAVTSLHQSYRSEESLKEVWRHENRPLALASYLLFPERVSSLDGLERLQEVVGRKLPVVLYPSHPGEESGVDRNFAEKIFQPTPEVMYRWGVRTPAQLVAQVDNRGYTGLCIDLYHMRSQEVDGVGLNPWRKSLPDLLSYAREIHISAGRVDMRQGHIDTLQELEELLVGQGNSELMQMLRAIRESGWTGRAVTEIPASALRRIGADKGSSYGIKNLIEDHRRIVGNLRDILG